MNLRINLLLLVLALAALPFQAGAVDAIKLPDLIRQLELDEQGVFVIPISRNRVTTITFPGMISALDGADITMDGKKPGLFLLSHQRESEFFSVRSMVSHAESNINVRYQGKTYSLILRDSPESFLLVNFRLPKPGSSSLARAKTPNRSALLGLLDKAKAYPYLKQAYPKTVALVGYRSFFKEPCVMNFEDYQIHLEEAWRFDPEDTVVFRIRLVNKTQDPIDYYAERFSIRVGDSLFPQSASDAEGIIPVNAPAIAYVAITGHPSGGRNEVSLKNNFTLQLARTGRKVEGAKQPANSAKKP